MRLSKIVCLLAAVATALTAFPKQAGAGDAKQQPVKLDLYVMSLCPFGLKAENNIFPVVKALGESVDLKLHFIANRAPLPDGADPKSAKPVFNSLHGQPEVEENIRQLCAMKNFPKQYMDFILERNTNIRNGDWRDAAKKVGIDPSKLEACSTGSEGAELLSNSIAISQVRNANASPTIELNGIPYTGARGTRSVTLAICSMLNTLGVPQPEACDKAKDMQPTADDAAPGAGCGDNKAGAPAAAPPVAFELKVLTDNACSFCQPTLVDAIKNNHAGATVTTLDINSDDGKAFAKQHDVKSLPYYFMDAKVAQDPNFSSMKPYYEKKGEGYTVIPSINTYMPAVQLERERAPRHLDLFVESLSHFTAEVEGKLINLLAESDAKDLTFSIHFIVQETAKGVDLEKAPSKSPSTDVRAAALKDEFKNVPDGPLTSRRGEQELQESMRQVCLFQHAPAGTFFTYLACRNQNIMDTNRADTCLQMTDSLKQCLQGPEAEKLLRQDARLVRELGITSGPVLLWENRYGPFGWHEVDWKEMTAEPKK